MTLAEAIEKLSDTFRQVRWERNDKPHLAPSGDPYVEIAGASIHKDGERSDVYCIDEATAVRLWYAALIEYANSKIGNTIYWRIEPELSSIKIGNTFDAHMRYMVYSRLWIGP